MKLRAQHKEILERLKHSPKKSKDFTHKDTTISHLGFHYTRYLSEMEQVGYVVCIPQHGEEIWHITEHGRNALSDKKTPVKKRIAAGTTYGLYDGRELTRTCMRDGAYDFLQHPSRMDNSFIKPRGAL